MIKLFHLFCFLSLTLVFFMFLMTGYMQTFLFIQENTSVVSLKENYFLTSTGRHCKSIPAYSREMQVSVRLVYTYSLYMSVQGLM